MFQTLFQVLAEGFKAKNTNDIYSIGTYLVAVCDNTRISRSHLYQGETWREKITTKRQYFYGLKAHLMVTEAGHIIESFFTPGGYHDALGMRYYRFDLRPGSVVYADKAYYDYGIGDALQAANITLKQILR